MSKKITKISFILFYALFYLLLLNSNAAFASEKIILKLKWLHQFQSAGYYAALDQGYFADEGLDVKLGIVAKSTGWLLAVLVFAKVGAAKVIIKSTIIIVGIIFKLL